MRNVILNQKNMMSPRDILLNDVYEAPENWMEAKEECLYRLRRHADHVYYKYATIPSWDVAQMMSICLLLSLECEYKRIYLCCMQKEAISLFRYCLQIQIFKHRKVLEKY